MIGSIFFQLCSLFYIFLLIVVYFSKKRLKSVENRLYILLAITNFLGLFLDIFSVFTIRNMNTHPILNFYISKFYLIYLLTWITLFTIYIFIISTKNKSNAKTKEYITKIFTIFSIIYSLLVIAIIVLPLYCFNENNVVYSYGPSASLLYIVSGIYMIIWIICMISNLKNIKSKKYFPIFAYMIIGIVVIYIQMNNPGLLLMSSMETFVTFLMYFTIENPDLKIIEELNIARDQADKANNAKSEFLSNMSHEIRTPLNAIVGFSQALEEENLPDEAKDEVKDIIMASQSLLEIVNGILDISKIEANKLEIVNAEYDFNKVLEELVALTRARMGDKPLQFKTSFDPTIPTVLYGDHTRIKQIILNLLTNAVKYTKEGYINFKVDSVIKEDVCRLIISVEDSGIGIKEENINKLFSKFERFDLEKNITIEGTGLGLAITKKLVDLMNGKIVVQSTYGEGSRFTVAIDQKIVKTPTITIKDQNEQKEVKAFDVSGKRILVVDDNKLNLKVATRLLKEYNVEIETIDSGFECIEKIKAGQTYDLILMDDMMPKMTGTETIAKLKQIEGYNIPTIALTANAISGMKEKYMKAGFDGYLSKPIDKLELNRIINDFLNK